MAINTITKYYGADTYFNGNVTFYKDVNINGNLNYDSLTVRNLNVSGISTLNNVKIAGAVYDSKSGIGSTDQVLVSNGSSIIWKPFVSAVGGGTTTEITVGNYGYRVHQFTANGTFAVTIGGPVEYVIIGGGGGGGGRYYSGGGGAGGCAAGEFTVLPNTNYDVVIGEGGTGGQLDNEKGIPGNPSSFGNIIAAGGGGGGSYNSYPMALGSVGGCGGGNSGYIQAYNQVAAGSQGYRGGTGGLYGGAGGGGLGGVGSDGDSTNGGPGGPGKVFTITGTPLTLGGGGGGGAYTGNAGFGGPGGGGAGSPVAGSAVGGSYNTGGGGGGARSGTGAFGSGNGGPGIVIVRYRIY